MHKTLTKVDTVRQTTALRTIASTISLVQIPTPQLQYSFLLAMLEIVFICKSPQASGSALDPISLLMSFNFIPNTEAADHTGTAKATTKI